MKKKLFFVLLALALTLMPLLSACESSVPPADTTESTADTPASTVGDTNTTPEDSEDNTSETVDIPETQPVSDTESETESEARPLKTFKNPILDRAAADPYIVYHDGYYYGTFTEALGIAVYRSRSLETVFSDEKQVVFNIGGEIQGNVWAPELFYHPVNDRWYIYACGSLSGWDFFTIRMFCLESKTNDPFGEYEYKGCTDPNLLAIDQTVFYDEQSGTLYTAYSEFTDAGQVIMVAVMENPWTLSDQRIRVSYPRFKWEKMGEREDKDSRVNEGPIFLYHEGKLCLIYSASGCWSQYYCLGMIEFTGDDFSPKEMMSRSNWDKRSAPVFSAANDVYGVGHCSFFTSPDGSETWIAYHGMPTPDAGEEGRFTYAQRISFDKNGWPVLGEPLSRDQEIPVPSGQPDFEAVTDENTESGT